MKRLLPLIATLFAIACCAAQNLRKVPLADPFILLYDGVYYAYGTGAGSGIEVWTSRDLSTWERAKGNARDGLALHRTDVWGEKWFWAPEVYRLNDKFYMYFTAEEHICVATSDSPLGPFVQETRQPMIADEKCIDNTLFIDDDGRAYMYFDRFNDGLNIWVVELEDDCTTLKKETMRPCIHVSQEWEKVWPRVNEGCFVIRRNGTYYMTYSANSYESPFYGIGCATADSPLGPWTKYAVAESRRTGRRRAQRPVPGQGGQPEDRFPCPQKQRRDPSAGNVYHRRAFPPRRGRLPDGDRPRILAGPDR